MSSTVTIVYASPIGEIAITGNEEKILSVQFDGKAANEEAQLPEAVMECKFQLDEYFTGKRRDFQLPLEPRGTSFQLQVWEQLSAIPYGGTISYMDLALRIGDEKSVRAVGAANGKNPIGIIIPCHRVIGVHQQLVGYAGGLWRKKWLLEHEAKWAHGVQKLF